MGGSPRTSERASDRRIPAAPISQSQVSRSEEDDARNSSKYRAALEAMFARKSEPIPAAEAVTPRPTKIARVPVRDDPRREERDKRYAKLLAAEGRTAVTRACEAYLRAGFTLPEEQDAMLKVLDHDRDDRVLAALTSLAKLLDVEAPQRRAVLEARLRRLEDDADDAEVRALATTVRAKLLRASSPR
jgi:hypothetical protein